MGLTAIVFGTTGVDKSNALERYRNWCALHKSRKLYIVNFEKEFLWTSTADRVKFLDAEQSEQRRRWRTAWSSFSDKLSTIKKDNPDSDIFINMHGCAARGYYGARSLIQPEHVAAIRPDRIVTLIDNVYDQWWRTDNRAGDVAYRGRPTIEQLLFARRVETIVADQVANARDSSVPHLVLSVHHPCETLWNWLVNEHPKVVYLCFPISAPRDMLADQSDRSGIRDINNFLREAFARQSANPRLVLLCPLTIDELPLTLALQKSETLETVQVGKEQIEALRFDREKYIWNLSEVIDPKKTLCGGIVEAKDRKPIPTKQIRDAAGMIKTDVGWRDYRMIDQANYLTAFSPKFINRPDISRSVYNELQYASDTRRIPVFIYQDPKHDPSNPERFAPIVGTMDSNPGQQMITPEPSIEAMFKTLEED